MHNNRCVGVAIVSFGTLVYLSNDETTKILSELAKLPFNIIWKLSQDNRQGIPNDLPKNVRLETWIPQNDLLNHTNTKVFITHCGINGIFEAAYKGVPMVGYPKFGDQPTNCQKLVYTGTGVVADPLTFTTESLYKQIMDVGTNESYKHNAVRLSRILNKMGGADEAAYWFDYQLNYGVDHLIPKYETEFPFWERFLLDVIAFYLLILFIIVYIIVRFFKKIFFCCYKRKNPINSKKTN